MKRVAIKRGDEYLASHYITENQMDHIMYHWDNIQKNHYYSEFMNKEQLMKCSYIEDRVMIPITEDFFALIQPHNFMIGDDSKDIYYNSDFIKIDIGY